MSITRRQLLVSAAALAASRPIVATAQPEHGVHGAPAPRPSRPMPAATPSGPRHEDTRYTPVVLPNSTTLPWEIDNGVKVFRLVAEPVRRAFAPGLEVNCWGYNGASPGPVIEAVEGDRVRIYVTNRLPASTTVHWHGVLLPNGMDGIGGLTQPKIKAGQTFKYEFTLRNHGTLMYHPHFDEMFQMALGMMGFFVVHPKTPRASRVDRDFAILLHEWLLVPGSYTPDPTEMTNFNLFTFNGAVFPATAPLVARLGDRVRIRIGNLSTTNSHPIHLHGFAFRVTGTDGGPIPEAAQWPETTISVPTGSARDVEFVADAEGDWGLHCHKVHHLMNGMGHNLPVTLGVKTDDLDTRIRKHLPNYMPMGTSMAEMMEMGRPANTIGSRVDGPFGDMDAGGMFTVVKVRAGITGYDDPGWYKHPPGTVAEAVTP